MDGILPSFGAILSTSTRVIRINFPLCQLLLVLRILSLSAAKNCFGCMFCVHLNIRFSGKDLPLHITELRLCFVQCVNCYKSCWWVYCCGGLTFSNLDLFIRMILN